LAKNRGLISSVKEVIDEMLAKGYYIENNLVKKILKEVNEL
jgi:predicted nucleic acid-binding protein